MRGDMMKILILLIPFLLAATPSNVEQQYFTDEIFNSNPGFEAGSFGWTYSGASTMTIQSTQVASGARALEIANFSAGKSVISDAIFIPQFARGDSCSVSLNYFGSAVNKFDMH